MAQIEWVHERLLAWAERVTVGDGDGYAAVNVLHTNWSPPAKGSRPSPKISLAVAPRSSARTRPCASWACVCAIRWCCSTAAS